MPCQIPFTFFQVKFQEKAVHCQYKIILHVQQSKFSHLS